MSARVALWPSVLWLVLAVVAGALALRAIAAWTFVLLANGPIMFGEGAVAHAGLLVARGLDPYGPTSPGTFVAANHPPLGYAIVALGSGLGPFVGLRAANVVAMLLVALAVVRRARSARLAGVALGASFLALFPVEAWGPAHRVDPLAVALAAAAVLAAGPRWRDATVAGVLGALAIAAKPTEALPLLAVLGYLLARERIAGLRTLAVLALATGALAAASLARFDAGGMWRHLVEWNLLPYAVENLLSVVLIGLVVVGGFALLAAIAPDGRMRAYLAGALAVVVLAGREGATINYLLDLCAASCLALAPAATARPWWPAALAAELAVATALWWGGAFGSVGSWTDPRLAARAADLARTAPHLAEDSGVLVANGIEPEVDDLFLWARLVSRGAIADEITPRARDGAFASVVSLVALTELDRAAGYERQRWPAPLVSAVLASYRLEIAEPGHYRYVPRRAVARDDGLLR